MKQVGADVVGGVESNCGRFAANKKFSVKFDFCLPPVPWGMQTHNLT
jgi:hypothetical protein